jgi:DNA-binding transcriptional ArsR family regulator
MPPKKSANVKTSGLTKVNQAQSVKDNAKKIDRAAFIIRAVQNPDRQRILRYILANNESVVSQLCSKLKVEQSIMSQHLAILRTANLVTTRREGKYIYYTLATKNWNKVIELVGRLGEL